MGRLEAARARARSLALGGAAVLASRPVGMSARSLRWELDSIWSDVKRTREARRILAALRARNVVQTDRDLDIRSTKRSDTVFILGSGSSVNALSKADWTIIGRHDTIGFNLWLIHEYVPTFYFIELGTESLAGDPNDSYQLELLCRREPDLRDMPVIAESKCWLRPDGFAYPLPPQLHDILYFYAPYYLRTTSPEVVASVLGRSRLWWRHASCDLRVMVHHRASLSAVVLFAFLAGYDNIILVGVDLNDSRYFWEANPAVLKGDPAPPTEGDGGVHVTVDATATCWEMSIPVDAYLRLLLESTLLPAGVSLSVANPASRLSSFLPVYRGLSLGSRSDTRTRR